MAPIVLARAVAPLNGPWKFRLGDDPRWAEPSFDDRDWESVDLTPPTRGAHDGDVGLTGYVPGWTGRGHAGKSGFAWYRLRVAVASAPDIELALTGPPDVDDAYQVFVNGRLVGSAGDFSRATPVVYSIQPRIFSLRGERDVVIAFRTWMSAGTLAEGPDVGGIHIAPAIGEARGIYAWYQSEWIETVRGYVVEVIEAAAFVLLAVMAASLAGFNRPDPARLWLVLALLVLATVRANQAIYFWAQWESRQAFDLLVSVMLIPLGLAAWTMAWFDWLRLPSPWRAVRILTPVYVVSQLLTRSWFPGTLPAWALTALHFLSETVRLLFVLLIAGAAYRGIRSRAREGWFALPAIVLISVGLFAGEVTALGIQGIWFPFGTGVSRTQFAYAAFDVVAFALLLRHVARPASTVELARG